MLAGYHGHAHCFRVEWIRRFERRLSTIDRKEKDIPEFIVHGLVEILGLFQGLRESILSLRRRILLDADAFASKV